MFTCLFWFPLVSTVLLVHVCSSAWNEQFTDQAAGPCHDVCRRRGAVIRGGTVAIYCHDVGRQLPLSYLDTLRNTYVFENYMNLFFWLWHRFLSYPVLIVTWCCKNQLGAINFLAVLNLVMIKCVRNESILWASVRYLLKTKVEATTLDLVHHGAENAVFLLVPLADLKCHRCPFWINHS